MMNVQLEVRQTKSNTLQIGAQQDLILTANTNPLQQGHTGMI